MEILALDDEEMSLERLVSSIRQAVPQAAVHAYRDPQTALAAMDTCRCDVAFLDVELRSQICGVELAKRLKMLAPDINIVFTTGYSEFMKDAFALHASGYILKPVTAQKVRQELENLRNPVQLPMEKRLRIQCFGNFEVFLDGRPVSFHYNKTKELFAYLVDRKGASVTSNELCAALWEDDCMKSSTKSYLRNLFSDLKSTFEGYGLRDVLIKKRNSYAVDPAAFWCDSYEFEKGNVAVINTFHNQYMTQYSWAEYRLGELLNG